jgi:signal transduction histidine kinase
MSIDFLRRHPLFAGLPETDLERVAAGARPVELPAGQRLLEEGAPGDTLYVVLEGELEVHKRSGGRQLRLALRGPGAFIGETALLEDVPRGASVTARRDSRLLEISRADFDRVLSTSPGAALTVLHTVTERLRQTEGLLRSQEKMAALGTLAAGLTHELNNPAAAVVRAASQLAGQLAQLHSATAAMDALGLDPHQAEHAAELRAQVAARAAAPAGLSPLEQADREAGVEAWLEAQGLSNAWELAPALVGLGFDDGTLAHLAEHFSAAQLGVLARALAAGGSVYALLAELQTGAGRIAELVGAVKAYTYMDRAPVQDVDVRAALDNTLIILRHKLGDRIQVRREYEQGLPTVEGFAGELNQVWTNLLDNAADALAAGGTITIRALGDGDCVIVEIADDGPGIPAEVQARIFEPFFTTKAPGVGTGLGLATTYQIVQKHGGDITLRSKPGETCFRVRLPRCLPVPE